MNEIAVIFDMDGVLVDNLKYHVIAWLKFCENHNIRLTEEDFFKNLNGKNSQDSFKYIFQKTISQSDVQKFTDEKESLYRNLYLNHIKPAEGLIDFLKELKNNSVKIAIGTSAIEENIDFTLNHTKIKQYFDTIVHAEMVTHGKPAPDIYLKAAEILNVPIKNCVVFEDALLGVEAGLKAGMKVVGVTTSHTAEELKHTDLQIPNFIGLTYDKIKELLHN